MAWESLLSASNQTLRLITAVILLDFYFLNTLGKSNEKQEGKCKEVRKDYVEIISVFEAVLGNKLSCRHIYIMLSYKHHTYIIYIYHANIHRWDVGFITRDFGFALLVSKKKSVDTTWLPCTPIVNFSLLINRHNLMIWWEETYHYCRQATLWWSEIQPGFTFRQWAKGVFGVQSGFSPVNYNQNKRCATRCYKNPNTKFQQSRAPYSRVPSQELCEIHTSLPTDVTLKLIKRFQGWSNWILLAVWDTYIHNVYAHT